VCHTHVPEPLIRYAEDACVELLAGLPQELATSRVAAAQAARAATALRRPRPEILVSAAWLHSIGRVERLRKSDFAPVDGATYLLDQGWPSPTVSLVAHQMQSRLLAPAFGCAAALSLFERVQGWPSDIVDYAILTSGADGPINLAEGLERARQAAIGDPRVPATLREERQARLRRAGERVARALETSEDPADLEISGPGAAR